MKLKEILKQAGLYLTKKERTNFVLTAFAIVIVGALGTNWINSSGFPFWAGFFLGIVVFISDFVSGYFFGYRCSDELADKIKDIFE